MAKQTLQTFNPNLRAGLGMSDTLMLIFVGTAITAATNNLAKTTLPAADAPDRKGVVRRALHMVVHIQSPGTGNTGGSWTVTLSSAAKGTLGTAVIAHNASPLYLSVDLRDASLAGIELPAGDVLSLNVTGVPTGTLTGATGIIATLVTETYSVAG